MRNRLLKIMAFIVIGITMIACGNKNLPTVITSNATNVTSSSATVCGIVTDDGGMTVSSRGICYNVGDQTPTIEGSTTASSGYGTGSFEVTLTGLSGGTQYSYRAYATNSAGTAYGDLKSFTTQQSGNPNSEGYTGTYSVSAYNWDENEWVSWSNVVINTFNNNHSSNQGVYVQGLNGTGDNDYFCALGEINPQKNCIELMMGWAFTADTFYFTSEPGVWYTGRFNPVYTIGTSFYWLDYGSGWDGSGTAWLTSSGSNKLTFGPSDTPSYQESTSTATPYYANGYCFGYYKTNGGGYSGRFNVFTQITLTKVSKEVKNLTKDEQTYLERVADYVYAKQDHSLTKDSKSTKTNINTSNINY